MNAVMILHVESDDATRQVPRLARLYPYTRYVPRQANPIAFIESDWVFAGGRAGQQANMPRRDVWLLYITDKGETETVNCYSVLCRSIENASMNSTRIMCFT